MLPTRGKVVCAWSRKGKRRRKKGVRRQEIGVRREEIGVRREELGVRREEIGVRREEIGVRRERNPIVTALGETLRSSAKHIASCSSAIRLFP